MARTSRIVGGVTMQAEHLRMDDIFLVEKGPETFKRVPTAFEPETIWSDCREEKSVVYALSNEYPYKLHRFHPDREVIKC